jgi:hypothetical protein
MTCSDTAPLRQLLPVATTDNSREQQFAELDRLTNYVDSLLAHRD